MSSRRVRVKFKEPIPSSNKEIINLFYLKSTKILNFRFFLFNYYSIAPLNESLALSRDVTHCHALSRRVTRFHECNVTSRNKKLHPVTKRDHNFKQKVHFFTVTYRDMS